MIGCLIKQPRSHLQALQRGSCALRVPLHDRREIAGSRSAVGLGGKRERARVMENHSRVLKAAIGAQRARVGGGAAPGQVQDLAPLALQPR